MKILSRYTPLQIAIHVYAWSGLLLLVFKLVTGNLSANPIQDIERSTGRHAIVLLILSLMCTPVAAIFKWNEPLKRRRTLGLYAFLYVALHLIIFINLDYGLAWDLIMQNVIEKPRIVVGLLAFLLMLPLAITSFDIWKVRLGKNWKRLHWLVYLVAPLAILHFIWSKKGDVLRLQGEVLQPLLYGLVVAIFLILRIPPIKKAIASFSLRGLFSRKKDPQPPKPSGLKDPAQ